MICSTIIPEHAGFRGHDRLASITAVGIGRAMDRAGMNDIREARQVEDANNNSGSAALGGMQEPQVKEGVGFARQQHLVDSLRRPIN